MRSLTRRIGSVGSTADGVDVHSPSLAHHGVLFPGRVHGVPPTVRFRPLSADRERGLH